MEKPLSQKQEQWLTILKERFYKNINRHKGIAWNNVETRLKAHPHKLKALLAMEETGGEPDVIGYNTKTGEYVFYDCSLESPKGRRSLCYDRKAQEGRKSHPPKNNAVDMAAAMGIELLTEAEYCVLQTLGEFDTKTSSWINTPTQIRNLGGALFADRRYNHVFVYHNGADSYYAARGFRGKVHV